MIIRLGKVGNYYLFISDIINVDYSRYISGPHTYSIYTVGRHHDGEKMGMRMGMGFLGSALAGPTMSPTGKNVLDTLHYSQ